MRLVRGGLLIGCALVIMNFLGSPAEAAIACTLWDSQSNILVSCPLVGGVQTFPTTCPAGVSLQGFDPDDGKFKRCIGGVSGGTFKDADSGVVVTDPTDCVANVTDATLGTMCVDLDDSRQWLCLAPGADGLSSEFCDDQNDWVGGKPIWLATDGTLTYLLDGDTKQIRFCNNQANDATTFCHVFKVTSADGLLYEGICAGGTCDTLIAVKSGHDFTLRYGTTDVVQMLAGKNLLIPTANGWIGVRSGTASPDTTACNESGEVGNLYAETDQAPGQMLHVCDTDGWKQQGIKERRIWLPAAGCNNTTAGPIWDLPTTAPAVAACATFTNTTKGVLDFADASNLSAQITYKLPSTWTGAIDANIKWVSATASTNNVVWQLATSCASDADVDDTAFNTASTVTDAGKGTTLQTNDATITGVTATGCLAGDLIHFRIQRDSGHASDNFAGTARLIGVELVIREAY